MHDPAEWSLPDDPPRLAEGDLHVWRIVLSDAALRHARSRGAIECLAAAERERAARLREPERSHWRLVRSAQRHILGGYLGIPAVHLSFATRADGKPTLATPAGAPLRFNVSHTRGLALLAVASAREVGVDLERLRAVPNAEAIARRVLPPGDSALIDGAAEGLRDRLFLEAWTRHEAVVKLTGQGVFGRARRDPPPGILVLPLEPARGYIACVATEGEPPRLRRFDYR